MLLIDTLRQVLGKVGGCPEGEAVDAMRDTVIEFCAKTRCWSKWDAIPTTGTAGAIDMALQVVDIIDAEIGGVPIAVLEQNAPELKNRRSDEMVLVFEHPNIVTLVPTPSAEVTLNLFRAFAPGPEAEEFPDFIWLRHSEALRQGCLGRLFASPGAAWEKPALSGTNTMAFQAAINDAAAEYGINRKTTAQRLRVRVL